MRYALLVLAGLLWYSSTEYSIIRYPVHKNKNNRFTKTKRFELAFSLSLEHVTYIIWGLPSNRSVECMVHSLSPEQINVALPRASTIAE